MTSSAAFPLNVQIQGSGYSILCLHGHPGSAASMSVFTEHLSQRFQTIAPDLRGYGRSQTSEPFTMQDHLIDLEALLDRLNTERTLILGWSLGGILAMELALTGDFITHKSANMHRCLSLLSDLAAPDGCWVVRGNHDYPVSLKEMRALCRDYGFRLLENEHVVVRPSRLRGIMHRE
ncbi:MAG: alpha/beta fold hydrolase, partial [Leptolyngbyaceae cyanobacterium SM1_3_5]|nr:alpha/beta fold hydrolase [Leptolyngbyaceae cyanobacterium SM1_3_5]